MVFNKNYDVVADFRKRNYSQIFHIRWRTGRRDYPEKIPINSRQQFFLQNTNAFSHHKNILYFHIPFCVTRCKYCPFFSIAAAKPSLIADYLDALEKEILMIKDTPYVKSTYFECVFTGGGTPSILSSRELARLSDMITNNFNLTENVESTLEANPHTLTKEKVNDLKQTLFNRVSLGVQSFQNSVLKELNCAHTREQAIQIIDQLFDQGIAVNIDLLFGLVGQSKAGWEKDLAMLGQFKPPHQLTLFPLRIVSGTPLYELLKEKGELDLEGHRNFVLALDAFTEKYLAGHHYIREEVPIFYFKKDSHPHRYHSAEGRIVGLGSNAGTILDGVESANNYRVKEYMTALKNNQFPIILDAFFTEEQIYERFVLHRILFMNRSHPDFKDIIRQRFKEMYHHDLGSIFDKVVHDMKALNFIEKNSDRIVFKERFWKILSHLRIGTPSIL